MTDRYSDVLASIDAELTKCICGNPIPGGGVSLDYCSPRCQYRAMAERVGVEPEPELTYPLSDTETDGLAINREVNRRFRPGASGESWPEEVLRAIYDRFISQARQQAREWDEAMERLQAAFTGPYADELEESLLRLGGVQIRREPAEPCTPEEFRARALEARQTRNTGPTRRDNRRWRNQ